MKNKRLRTAVCISLASLLLTACSAGGGSFFHLKFSFNNEPGFTSWSDTVLPATVKVNGMSVETTYTAPAPSYAVTDVGTPKESQTASAQLTYDSSGSLTKVTIQTPNTSVTWDKSAGDTIVDNSGLIELANLDGTNVGVATSPQDVGWNYQTFGIWISDNGTGAGTAGAISTGAATPGSSIPTTGKVTFYGATSGIYVDPDGTSYITGGELSVNTDFLNRSLKFNTLNTVKLVDPTTNNWTGATNLDMSGTLTYSPGTNLFSGNVATTDLSGMAKGRFYGPHAEEMGGYFGLRGSGVESYPGGFGGKQ